MEQWLLLSNAGREETAPSGRASVPVPAPAVAKLTRGREVRGERVLSCLVLSLVVTCQRIRASSRGGTGPSNQEKKRLTPDSVGEAGIYLCEIHWLSVLTHIVHGPHTDLSRICWPILLLLLVAPVCLRMKNTISYATWPQTIGCPQSQRGKLLRFR
jgi:hypothetical protein